jgi:hypothetical protein
MQTFFFMFAILLLQAAHESGVPPVVGLAEMVGDAVGAGTVGSAEMVGDAVGAGTVGSAEIVGAVVGAGVIG